MAPTARGFLEDARRLQERIRHASEQVEQADALLGLHGLDSARERVGGLRHADSLAERVGDLQRYRDDLAGLLADYVELQRFASGVIARLPDARHQQVLNMRYLEGREYCDIAAAMGYGERRAYSLHRDSLAALDAVLAEGRGE
ncbi:sigma factor-like helix-turn-helix DNA-binding protein [Arabiibacter massiliensis]|uniref:sigma factor-like helix-turn-helix DNA-binding protein n=1 Tax=Arabiibacter massiliensis TaxID=1870985 RepID=UPI0009B98730|nr:sigma factor-like helix-turn-helix DNA-binding protein [Arabiibacter massiliensis]